MKCFYKKILVIMLFCTFVSSAVNAQVMSFYEKPVTPPPITWQDLQGDTLSLSDFKGKVVLINLWATWCAPCLVEMPAFNFLQKRYKDGGFEIIPIAINDTPMAVAKYMKDHSLDNLTPYIDSNDTVGKIFRPKSTPTTYLINRKGQIIAGREGLSEWLSPEMMSLIETELKKGQATFTLPNGMEVINRNDVHGSIHR